MTRRLLAGALLFVIAVGIAPAATAAAPAAPDILGCKSAPTPEVPGRGVVGFFESAPKTVPPAGDPFAKNPTTSIYQQYGYAGLRWNTYDLGCGPDLARAPDAAIGTAVANWIVAFPKAAVAATGAVVGAAFQPDFLGAFDPLISEVVDTLRRTVFDQWAFLVVAALGLMLIWRARQAPLASATAAVGWALLVMVLVTMVFRWPLVAGHAADQTVTTTLGAVSGGLNNRAEGSDTGAGAEATAGMHEALLYQAWLGGTFGDANSEVARTYGPVIFDSQALTWREAEVLRNDPAAGKKIIEAKQEKFEATAGKIKDLDPDAYDYLTGKRSDTRVGYALLSALAALCAVPFLLVAGLLVLGALIIVRFGVMLFPAFATLGLFPTMRALVTGVGSTMASALINAVVFGIGAAITVRGMGVLLAPATGTPPWLDVVLLLLLTIVMWVALRPFRRLTQMVSSRTNHFGTASGGVTAATRTAARTSGRIITQAIGTFLGVSAAGRRIPEAPGATAPGRAAGDAVPQRVEAVSSFEGYPSGPEPGPDGVPGGVPATPDAAPAPMPVGSGAGPAVRPMEVTAGSVTVLTGTPRPGAAAPSPVEAGAGLPGGGGSGTGGSGAGPPPAGVRSGAAVAGVTVAAGRGNGVPGRVTAGAGFRGTFVPGAGRPDGGAAGSPFRGSGGGSAGGGPARANRLEAGDGAESEIYRPPSRRPVAGAMGHAPDPDSRPAPSPLDAPPTRWDVEPAPSGRSSGGGPGERLESVLEPARGPIGSERRPGADPAPSTPRRREDPRMDEELADLTDRVEVFRPSSGAARGR